MARSSEAVEGVVNGSGSVAAPVFLGSRDVAGLRRLRLALSAHPRLFLSHLPGETDEVFDGLVAEFNALGRGANTPDARRAVWLSTAAFERRDWLTERLPGVRFVELLGAGVSARAESKGCLTVRWEQLVAQPAFELARLFRFLGEAPSAGCVNALATCRPVALRSL